MGVRGQTKGTFSRAMGWLPFGRHGFVRARARRKAKAHLGEVELSLTNRGNLVSASLSFPLWWHVGFDDPHDLVASACEYLSVIAELCAVSAKTCWVATYAVLCLMSLGVRHVSAPTCLV